MRPNPNPYLHAAVLAGASIQIAASLLPITAGLLGDASIPAELWALVLGGAVLAWALVEGCSRIIWRRHGAKARR
jgi:Ca2+-transporting ATPase